MSKGSQRRPMAVSQEQFARNWELAFSNHEPPKPEPPTRRWEGVVVLGDSFRCGDDENQGSICLAARGYSIDLISELDDSDMLGSDVTLVITSDKEERTFRGILQVTRGSSYSEWTPLESDEVAVGPLDLIELLETMEGQHITLQCHPSSEIEPEQPEMPPPSHVQKTVAQWRKKTSRT